MSRPMLENGSASGILAGGLHRWRLGNGLRVLVAPDHSAPAIGVAVLYDVGHRSEPEGREGFAHLFEHLMFQGSENLDKLAHAGHVHRAGGSFNGTTHPDHTSYYQVLPAQALELALFLEADRMRAPRLTEEGLANQVAVVEQEIRRKILDNPLGGLPSPRLPAVMFDDFANAHDGWGAVERLRTVTTAECRAFFETYYTPANALLVVCGAADPDTVATLAERHFGAIPGTPAPPRRSDGGAGGAAPVGDRHHDHVHPGAPTPAFALGWRMPGTARPDDRYPAALVLARILTDGPDSPLQNRLIRDGGSVSQLAMAAGLGGVPFEVRDPDVLAFTAILRSRADPPAVVDAVYEELGELAAHGPTPEATARAAATWYTSWLRALDPLGVRVQRLGAFELLHGNAGLAVEIPVRTRDVTPSRIAEAAAELVGQPRRWVTVGPARDREPAEVVV